MLQTVSGQMNNCANPGRQALPDAVTGIFSCGQLESIPLTDSTTFPWHTTTQCLLIVDSAASNTIFSPNACWANLSATVPRIVSLKSLDPIWSPQFAKLLECSAIGAIWPSRTALTVCLVPDTALEPHATLTMARLPWLVLKPSVALESRGSGSGSGATPNHQAIAAKTAPPTR